MSQLDQRDLRSKKAQKSKELSKMGKNDEAKRQNEQLHCDITTEVTEAVTAALGKRLEDLDSLLNAKGSGLKPRLEHMETIVEKGDNNISNQLSNLESSVTAIELLLGKPDPNHPFIDGIQKSLLDVQTQIEEIQSRPRVDTQPSSHDLDELTRKLDVKCEEYQAKMDCYDNAIGVLENKISDHEARITMNLAKHMSDNIKIGGLAEEYSENCALVASRFFENIMDLKPAKGDIIEAFRMKGALRRKI